MYQSKPSEEKWNGGSRNSKTLFDLEEHRDSVRSAQVALMLTFYAVTIDDATNSYWLSTAIHYARMGGADQYQTKGPGTERKATLKRLWWCCILRDRIMALGHRRPLQIRPTDFDFSQPGLLEDDIEDEIHGSRVYDPETKTVLLRLVASLCELVVAMNGILELCYPLRPGPESNRNGCSSQELRDSFSRLDEWHQSAVAKLQISARLPDMYVLRKPV
ncbi:hypothetical protein N0V84_004978 [Fusarium piperis]|uniref:Xylanolytic transcriptional activator regulatory domain-containing protein n=1 Tax=Fusarium piperis TaxID=1435070 RepID=A0A9W8WES0_9HYPO|nr:hypothetical protein N0V84_004978 [Fusarium piperis]